jgi:hypothetical protein
MPSTYIDDQFLSSQERVFRIVERKQKLKNTNLMKFKNTTFETQKQCQEIPVVYITFEKGNPPIVFYQYRG